MKVIWTNRASNNFDNIINYISEQNTLSAGRINDCILNVTKQLSFFPYIGKLGRIRNTREIVSCYPYIVIYTIKDNYIKILRIIHGSQKYP